MLILLCYGRSPALSTARLPPHLLALTSLLPCPLAHPAGGWVWCEEGRFPRRVLQPDWQGQPQEQCACMEDAAADDERRLYEECSPEAVRCQTSPPEEPAPQESGGGDAADAAQEQR